MLSIYSQYIAAILLYVASYIYALKFAVYIGTCNKKWCRNVNNYHEKCMVNCGEYSCGLTTTRGENYYIGVTGEEQKDVLNKCLVTFWGGSHFILYLLLGFFCPNLFWQTFILGVLFEIYEEYMYDCHDALDVVLNTAGFLIGRQFSF